MRWSAPNEAPKRHITGQRTLEWYNCGSQYATTVSLAGILPDRDSGAEGSKSRFSSMPVLGHLSVLGSLKVCCSWCFFARFLLDCPYCYILGFLQLFVFGFFLKHSRCKISDSSDRFLLADPFTVEGVTDSHRLKSCFLPRLHI